jgi:hypothetical protein
MEQYAPPTITPSTNDTDTELQTKHNNEIRNKTNQLWGIQTDDRTAMAGKYDRLEETAYSNPFETDEAKAILGKYDLSALRGRDNVIASGGASNGGNIDSYAAANAMRQQAALVNQGQMAVLEAHNNKINNAKGILESLGVYQQNQDKGMQTTINLKQSESQRLFENDQTAKNNDVARKEIMASVSGIAPKEWTYDNNPYLNSDGTVKDIYLTDDFDATGGFKTIIDDATAKLATTTDAAERANLQATIDAATQAKAIKTDSDPKYAQYAHQVQAVAPPITEARRKSQQDDATVRESLNTDLKISDNNLTGTKYVSDNQLTSDKYVTDKNLEGTKHVSDNQLTSDKYVTDKNLEGTKHVSDTEKEINDANNKHESDILDKTLAQQSNGIPQLSDEGNKVAKLIMQKVNKWSQDKYDVDVIEDLGRNTYKFNLPKDHDLEWWDDIVFQYIDESTLTEDEAATLIAQLGLGGYWDEWLVKTGKVRS